MKSLSDCNRLKKAGDIELVAKACGTSESNVRAILNEKRPDNFNVQKAFNILFNQKAKLPALVQQEMMKELESELVSK